MHVFLCTVKFQDVQTCNCVPTISYEKFLSTNNVSISYGYCIRYGLNLTLYQDYIPHKKLTTESQKLVNLVE